MWRRIFSWMYDRRDGIGAILALALILGECLAIIPSARTGELPKCP
jgi:hypothetical protein